MQAGYGGKQVIDGDTWNGLGNIVVGALRAASVKFPGGVTGVASNELKGVVVSELRGPCCFAAGTMVATPSGDRAIDTLKVGEIVWSKPENGGEPFAAAILATHVRTDQPIYRLKLESIRKDGAAEGETLLVTPSHPFYVPAQHDFVPAINLKPGDLLQSLVDGASENVSTRVKSLELFQPVGKTFNLTVDIGHTFYVGKLKTWVHNTGPCKIPQIILNRQNGIEFERQVVSAFDDVGGVKNTKLVTVELDNGVKVTTIPDMWEKTVGGLLEIKNVLNLSMSNQLRAQVKVALDTGQPLNIVVSPRTNGISAEVMRQVESTGGEIYRYNPATRELTRF